MKSHNPATETAWWVRLRILHHHRFTRDIRHAVDAAQFLPARVRGKDGSLLRGRRCRAGQAGDDRADVVEFRVGALGGGDGGVVQFFEGAETGCCEEGRGGEFGEGAVFCEEGCEPWEYLEYAVEGG